MRTFSINLRQPPEAVLHALNFFTQSISFGSSEYTKHENASRNSGLHGPCAIPPREGQCQFISSVSGSNAAPLASAGCGSDLAAGWGRRVRRRARLLYWLEDGRGRSMYVEIQRVSIPLRCRTMRTTCASKLRNENRQHKRTVRPYVDTDQGPHQPSSPPSQDFLKNGSVSTGLRFSSHNPPTHQVLGSPGLVESAMPCSRRRDPQ